MLSRTKDVRVRASVGKGAVACVTSKCCPLRLPSKTPPASLSAACSCRCALKTSSTQSAKTTITRLSRVAKELSHCIRYAQPVGQGLPVRRPLLVAHRVRGSEHADHTCHLPNRRPCLLPDRQLLSMLLPERVRIDSRIHGPQRLEESRHRWVRKAAFGLASSGCG